MNFSHNINDYSINSHYVALDAAQPGFEGHDERIRLHRSDARHVDALHTNARPFFQSAGLGYMGPLGKGDLLNSSALDTLLFSDLNWRLQVTLISISMEVVINPVAGNQETIWIWDMLQNIIQKD